MEPPRSTDRATDEPVTHALLDAVAAAEDLPPSELRPPLAEVIDPDALERLIENCDDATTVTFEYRGLRVLVRGTGAVEVTDPADDR